MTPNTESAIKRALACQPGVKLAIVFGSMVSNQERFDSDLDLAVDAGKRLTVSEKMTLIGDLALETGRPIDLVDLRSVGEPLLGQILNHGKRLLGSDTDYAALISRHLFNQADFVPYRNRILAERRRAWIGR